MQETQIMHRRAALGLLLGGAAVAATVTLIPHEAEALELPKLDAAGGTESLVENVRWWRRRRRCWRNRWGRVVCRW